MWYQVQWISKKFDWNKEKTIPVKNIYNSYKTLEEAEQSIYDW